VSGAVVAAAAQRRQISISAVEVTPVSVNADHVAGDRRRALGLELADVLASLDRRHRHHLELVAVHGHQRRTGGAAPKMRLAGVPRFG